MLDLKADSHSGSIPAQDGPANVDQKSVGPRNSPDTSQHQNTACSGTWRQTDRHTEGFNIRQWETTMEGITQHYQKEKCETWKIIAIQSEAYFDLKHLHHHTEGENMFHNWSSMHTIGGSVLTYLKPKMGSTLQIEHLTSWRQCSDWARRWSKGTQANGLGSLCNHDNHCASFNGWVGCKSKGFICMYATNSELHLLFGNRAICIDLLFQRFG